jgi:replicative DNA helicase
VKDDLNFDDYVLPNKAPEPPPEEKPAKAQKVADKPLVLAVAQEYALPHNPTAEKLLLGAVLMDSKALLEIQATLEVEDFALDSHQRIYQRMTDLAASNRGIDLVTLANELSRCKEIQTVGGVAYLSSLTEGLPRRPVIEEYIRIVADKSIGRQLMHIGNNAVQWTADQSETSVWTLDAIQQQMANLTERVRAFQKRPTEPFFLGYRSFTDSAQEEIEWTIEGLIQKEGNGLILGDSGTSKSVLIFDLAIHLVAGVAWFQHKIAERRCVGLVAREDAPGLSQSRLKRLVDGADESVRMFLECVDLEKWLYINTRAQRETWSLQKESDIQDIIESTKERGIQILFFDVFRELWEGNENDNQETAKVLAQAKRIGREANCQVAIVHHLSKSDKGTIFDRARGGGINGWKEWGFGLTVDNPDEPDPKNWIRKIQFHTKADSASPPVFYRIQGAEEGLRLEQVDSPTGQYTLSPKGKKKSQATQQPLSYQQD